MYCFSEEESEIKVTVPKREINKKKEGYIESYNTGHNL